MKILPEIHPDISTSVITSDNTAVIQVRITYWEHGAHRQTLSTCRHRMIGRVDAKQLAYTTHADVQLYHVSMTRGWSRMFGVLHRRSYSSVLPFSRQMESTIISYHISLCLSVSIRSPCHAGIGLSGPQSATILFSMIRLIRDMS